MSRTPITVDEAVGRLDPDPTTSRTHALDATARATLEQILAGEHEPEEHVASLPRRSPARWLVPAAVSLVAVVLVVRALLGADLRAPVLGPPEELSGADADAVRVQCIDRLAAGSGIPGHEDPPGPDASREAETLLVERRGDWTIAMLDTVEDGTRYLVSCVLERDEIVLIGAGPADTLFPQRFTASGSGPAEEPRDRLVWGLLPEVAVAAEAVTEDGVAVDVAVYDSGVYTLAWPEGELVRGEIVVTLDDGTSTVLDLH